MRDNLDSMVHVGDRPHRRNPAEWRKTGSSREAALAKLLSIIDDKTPWPELQGKRDIAALSLSLALDFAGDRVAAFIYASAGTMPQPSRCYWPTKSANANAT